MGLVVQVMHFQSGTGAPEGAHWLAVLEDARAVQQCSRGIAALELLTELIQGPQCGVARHLAETSGSALTHARQATRRGNVSGPAVTKTPYARPADGALPKNFVVAATEQEVIADPLRLLDG